MTRGEFRALLQSRAYFDEGERRTRVTPLPGDDCSLTPGEYLADPDWRAALAREMTAPDCNDRRYHLDADSPASDGRPRRMRLFLRGVFDLAATLARIDAEPGGVVAAHARVRRVDDPARDAYAAEFDAELGEGAHAAMMAHIASGAYVAPLAAAERRFKTPAAFWRYMANPRERGL